MPLATSAAAAVLPKKMPCRMRMMSRCQGLVAVACSAITATPAKALRMSIGLRPMRSPIHLQTGEKMNIATPWAAPSTPVHRAISPAP
ncbi:MAG: hypothetical protein U0531_08690 [Dehalococcoidia bacterium]